MHFPEWQEYSYTAVIGTLTLWKKHTVCVIAILLTLVIACTCLLNFLYNAVSACSPVVTSIHCQSLSISQSTPYSEILATPLTPAVLLCCQTQLHTFTHQLVKQVQTQFHSTDILISPCIHIKLLIHNFNFPHAYHCQCNITANQLHYQFFSCTCSHTHIVH